jgi:perosamine synthetase
MRVLRSGWLTTGPEVHAFEREFAEWVGAAHAVAVSSCTVAIELSLRAMRLPRGAKVLTSTMTFCGAVHAIVHAGLTPVLVDVGDATLMPDAATVAAAAERAGGVDAMVVLHFAGFPAPVEELAAAAGLPLARVVEDAAHALGTWVDDRPVGAISAATCFSFYATKNLPIGEGGMVTTADPALADYVRRGRLHGMSKDAWKRYLPGAPWYYNVDIAGLKANMTDLQAAIGRAQLRRLAGWQERRADLAGAYDEGLAGIPGLRPPPRPERGRHAWHLYVIRVEPGFGLGRDDLIAELADRGVGTFLYTPVEVDGTLAGPALDGLRSVAAAADRSGAELLYSGGVGTLEHLRELRALDLPALAGVIVGRALYEERFTVAEGEAALGPQAG